MCIKLTLANVYQTAHTHFYRRKEEGEEGVIVANVAKEKERKKKRRKRKKERERKRKRRGKVWTEEEFQRNEMAVCKRKTKKKGAQEPAKEKGDRSEIAGLRDITRNYSGSQKRTRELKVMIIRYTVGSFYKCAPRVYITSSVLLSVSCLARTCVAKTDPLPFCSSQQNLLTAPLLLFFPFRYSASRTGPLMLLGTGRKTSISRNTSTSLLRIHVVETSL